MIRRSGRPYTLSNRELASRTLVTAGAISQRVARAERDGLVRRAPGTTGRKSVNVSLTDEGHALIERSVDSVLSREASLVTGLPKEEWDTLVDLPAKLTANVQRRQVL